MIKKLLIANRGDVLRRIACTAQRLGVSVVALDGGESQVFAVDTWIKVVGEVQASHYLSGAQWVRWAQEYGAQALHPGWGFLAEDSSFARLVQESGLIWLGPSWEVMEVLACKHKARRLAQSLEIPVLGGCGEELYHIPQDEEALRQTVSDLGFPVLLKYSLGGGGRGIEVVREEGELREAARRCYEGGHAYFGAGGLLVEPYLEHTRHVEVQVLADHQGQVMSLGAREGTLQRRHQKIIEQSPPPGLDASFLQKLSEYSLQLTSHSCYRGAGTVEFLLAYEDKQVEAGGELKSDQGGSSCQIYFLEMNTRLQVEHALTEELYGVDLVEWQLRIACGEALSSQMLALQKVTPQRVSVQVRVCAEDPLQDFMPTSGRVKAVQWPTKLLPSLVVRRIELGSLQEGAEVSSYFDSLLAKVIITAPTRALAIKAMEECLGDFMVVGVGTNIDFLSSLVASEGLRSKIPLSSFLSQHLRKWHIDESKRKTELKELAESLRAELELLATEWKNPFLVDHDSSGGQKISEIFRGSSYREKGPILKKYPRAQVCARGVEPCGFLLSLRFCESGESSMAGILCREDSSLDTLWIKQGLSSWQQTSGTTSKKSLALPSLESKTSSLFDHDGVRAPTSGRVVRLGCVAGAKVRKGEVLLVLESMKMEVPVRAGEEAIVEEVMVQLGDHLQRGQEILRYLRKI